MLAVCLLFSKHRLQEQNKACTGYTYKTQAKNENRKWPDFGDLPHVSTTNKSYIILKTNKQTHPCDRLITVIGERLNIFDFFGKSWW